MENIIVKRDNNRDIKFSGEKIASAASSENNASSRYSGQPGRWTELALYRSAKGKYICSQIDHSIWDGERTRYSGAACATDEQVVEFFGTGWLVKCLYADIKTTAWLEKALYEIA